MEIKNNIAGRRVFTFTGLIVLYIILVGLALRYNDFPINDWRSELYSDKAGYYIYLPATFIHGYYQEAYPEGIENAMGHGYRFENGKLFTKYPAGVSVLVSPFFLIAHIIALAGPGPANGFSSVYYDMANYSSVFYMLLGAAFLIVFLRRRFTAMISFITAAVILLATNVYYYTFRDAMMSHVYSFALFSLLLLLTDNLWRNPKWRNLLWVALASGMIILVRPTNFIFLLIIPFLDVRLNRNLYERMRFLLAPLNLITFAIAVLLLLSPQLAYWKFISGKLIFNSYQGESFTFWNNPQIREVLYAPENGLLTYTPAFILVVAGMFVMLIRKEYNRWLIPAIFIMLLYLVSFWHAFHFGCSFGQRSFVEYYAIFALPLASLFSICYSRRNILLSFAISLIIIYLVYFNIKLTGVYNKCYFGETWNYTPYLIDLHKAKIFPLQNKTFTWQNDFESRTLYSGGEKSIIRSPVAYSGKFVSALNDSLVYSVGFNAGLSDINPGKLFKADVQFVCYFKEPPGETLLVCSISEGTALVYHKTFRLDDNPESTQGSWIFYRHTFEIPYLSGSGFIKVFVWGLTGKELYIDDMQVKLYFYKSPLI
jgi:hypothetical protein